MTILSLEFSSPVRSVAIWPNGASAEAQIEVTATDDRGARTHPITLIEKVLQHSQVDRREIDLIAVGLGPGSYTGIRSAIAIVQGWSLSFATKTMGISSADAIAEATLKSGIVGTFHVVIDAQRDEFYVADYDSDGSETSLRNELRILTRDQISKLKAPLTGPTLNALGLTGIEIDPRARVVGQIADRRETVISAADLVPIYLRDAAFVKAPAPRILPN
jgi:tRNA threonylcarbamoyladenosine biosynthesis protein TsaB